MSASYMHRDGMSAESSLKSVSAAAQGGHRAAGGYGAQSRSTGIPASHTAASGQRSNSNWALSRPSAVSGRRSYRMSNARRTTSSRNHDIADAFASIKLVDEQGVNRTPKPLVAIVTSAALRQARGIATEESVVGSDAGDGLFDIASSTGFSKGWFDSEVATPQEAEAQDYQGRLLAAANALPGNLQGERSLLGLGTSSTQMGMLSHRPSHDTSSLSSSARPTGDAAPSASAAAAAAASSAAFLTEDDLAKPHKVLLQETDNIVMWDMPGIVVAADSSEGAQVAAANSQYTALLAAHEASDKFTSSVSQTLVPLKKQREVQSGTSSSNDTACQASRWDIDDSYAAVEKSKNSDSEEQLGSVLPSGAVVATGAARPASGYQSNSQQASFRNSQQNWGRPSTSSSFIAGGQVSGGDSRRFSRIDSIAGGWSRPSTSAAGSTGGKGGGGRSSSGSASGATATALLAVNAAPQVEPWTKLPGLADVLSVMEAAISQNVYLPQLLLYRDIKPPPPPSQTAPAAAYDSLSSTPSMSSTGSHHHLAVVPPTPSMSSRQSNVGALLSSRGATSDNWAGSPHTAFTNSGAGVAAAAASAGASTGGMSGASAAGSVAATPGAGPRSGASATGAGLSSMSGFGQMSRRPSAQLPMDSSRQSSFVSMSSSRLMRGSRPPAGLQLLWTWSCSLTEGLPVTSIAWNSANTNLIAAGYRYIPAADAVDADAAAADEMGNKPGSAGSAVRPTSGSAATAAKGSGGGSSGDDSGAADGATGAAAEVAGAEMGRVAIWSLKNQLHPVWTFETNSAVTALDFSQRSPYILGVGLHDGTIAVYDVRSRQPTPSMASTADTGKHSDPVWKVRWLDRGPEREELLVSISTDGKVKAWTIAKGLEHSTLITLKRVSRRLASANSLPAGSGAKAAATVAALRGSSGVSGGDRDALISRNTGGMSFDFNSTDSRIYLAGTEDGHIHKCSTSYSEQYLESYTGHIGPVYALQWSPFNPSLFISCSGDWTIRLWQEGRQQQLLSFQSSNEEVLDVQWCPSNSTVFGAVTAGGRLELWDFAVSTLRPVVQHCCTKCSLTALMFAKDAPVVIAANDSGGLLVFRLINIAADSFEPPEMQQSRLEEALRVNVMKAALAGAG